MKKHRAFRIILIFLCIFAAAGAGFLAWYKKAPAIRRHPGAACVLTQHFDATGAQCMFYTLETKGGLVVIDGGSAANSEYVRSVIADKGGRVLAWIITHGHPDHVGAFNEIYADPKDIIIDNVYSTDFDLDAYHELCNWWDEPEYYDRFWELTHGSSSGETDSFGEPGGLGGAGALHTLSSGDSLSLGGLTIDVFSSFSEVGTDYGDDIANLGSLLFKVTAGSSTVLFCSDIYDNRGLYGALEDAFGDSLKADYLQMGHHGNNSCTHEFIEAVDPKAAFMDCPEGFFSNPDYDSAENKAYLEGRGTKVYSFGTTPNEIILR